VTQPQLYQSYGTEKIVSFFGSPDEAQGLCNGQWLIFPKAVICVAHFGKGPERSFFENGSHFYWVADQPYHVNSGPYWDFVPAQVVGSAGKDTTRTKACTIGQRCHTATIRPSLGGTTARSHGNRRTSRFPNI
jgi:hypothetical protein